jgi:hypothetical protein
MIPTATLEKIEELRAKGWFFDLKCDKTGWECVVLGIGLANGHCSGPSLQEAVEGALAQATAMVDDPEVFIKAHGKKIEELVKEQFGKDAFLGLEAVEWEAEEPCRLCIRVKGGKDVSKTVDAESAFYTKAFECLPEEVAKALTFEIEWPEETNS